MKKVLCIVSIGFGMVLAAGPALASSLVYTPTNPTFGGNAANGTFLLSTAQAQGAGAKSGSNSTDLSGLTSALSSLSSSSTVANPTTIIVEPTN